MKIQKQQILLRMMMPALCENNMPPTQDVIGSAQSPAWGVGGGRWGPVGRVFRGFPIGIKLDLFIFYPCTTLNFFQFY